MKEKCFTTVECSTREMLFSGELSEFFHSLVHYVFFFFYFFWSCNHYTSCFRLCLCLFGFCCSLVPSLVDHFFVHVFVICLFFCYLMLSFLVRSFVYSFAFSFVRSFVSSFARQLIHSFLHSFLHSFVYAFVPSLVRLFVRLFVRSLLCPVVYSFVRSFVCSCVRSLVSSFLFFVEIVGRINFLITIIYYFLKNFSSLSKVTGSWLRTTIGRGNEIISLQSTLQKWFEKRHQSVRVTDTCLGPMCNPTCSESLKFVDTAVDWGEVLNWVILFLSLVPTGVCVAVKICFMVQLLLLARNKKRYLGDHKESQQVKLY